MNLKTVRWQILHGSIARRVVFRLFFIASVVSIVPLLHILSDSDLGTLAYSAAFRNCIANSGLTTAKLFRERLVSQSHFLNPIWGSFRTTQCQEIANLTVGVVRELKGMKLISNSSKALCVGEGSEFSVLAMRELGISDAVGVSHHSLFSLKRKQIVQELDFLDHSFDFVFSRDLDKLSAPALLVLEIERVLTPGGVGAVIVYVGGSTPNGLIRSATPVSSLLKTSSVVHVGYINNFTLVVFKKKYENVGSFGQYRLPSDCPALMNNKPFIAHMEPIVKQRPMEFEKRLSYLPMFLDVSSRKRLVYIDIGAGKHLKTNSTSWFPTFYPVDRKAFNTYFVDHNTSVLLSYVKKPGITFVYHPGLAGTAAKTSVPEADEGTDDDPFAGYEGFDFLGWFKETVQYADFVVLKLNTGSVELKFISDLFESGVICFVDEVFLGCSDGEEGEGYLKGDDCLDLFNGLRSRGVFVHQWWEDNSA